MAFEAFSRTSNLIADPRGRIPYPLTPRYGLPSSSCLRHRDECCSFAEWRRRRSGTMVMRGKRTIGRHEITVSLNWTYGSSCKRVYDNVDSPTSEIFLSGVKLAFVFLKTYAGLDLSHVRRA